jgi:hypothetical protein
VFLKRQKKRPTKKKNKKNKRELFNSFLNSQQELFKILTKLSICHERGFFDRQSNQHNHQRHLDNTILLGVSLSPDKVINDEEWIVNNSLTSVKNK